MRSMSNATDFQEPKQFNTVALLNQRNHIKILLDNKLHNPALQEMCSLVCEFDLTPKDTQMIEVKKNLMKNYQSPFIQSFEDMMYFNIINDYMNHTYFRGFKAPMGEDFFKELDEQEETSVAQEE
jgi:hypothetical protein